MLVANHYRRARPRLLSLFFAVTLAGGCRNAGATKTSALSADPVAPANARTLAAASVPPTSAQTLPAVATPSVASESQMRTEDEKNTIGVFRAAAASAVFVTQRQVVIDRFLRRAEMPTGSGSGFVWDKEGHVVTNFHVVQDAKRVSVTLQDQRTFEAQIVGVEPRKDIAVLKIEAPAKDLQPIGLPAQRVELEVGQKVIAIGNPFGLDHTLTTGVISALGREVDGIGGVTIRDMVQTDAAINPGNSGGPLLDSAGRLIGMNTMIFSRSGSSAGIGFAVPVQTIARVVPQIIKNGHAEQVGLGISVDGQQRIERQLGIRGIVVVNVQPGTPAAQAGLKGLEQTARGIALGDIIVGIDNDKVQNYDDLYNALDRHSVGDTVTVKVMREKQALELSVKLVRVQ